jgi:hypothetical protein
MNRIGVSSLALLAFVLTAFGAMDDKDFSATVAGTSTGTAAYVIRGELEGIYIDVTTATTTTQTVTLASSQQTLYTKDISADVWVPLRFVQYGSTGSALTYYTGNETNWTSTAVYGKAPLAGSVTLTVVGKNAASTTNTTAVKVIYNK